MTKRHKQKIRISIDRLTAPVTPANGPKTLCAGCGEHHTSPTTRVIHGGRKVITLYFQLLACASKHGWFFVSIDGLLLATSILFVFIELPAIDEGIKAFVERFADVQDEIDEVA